MINCLMYGIIAILHDDHIESVLTTQNDAHYEFLKTNEESISVEVRIPIL